MKKLEKRRKTDGTQSNHSLFRVKQTRRQALGSLGSLGGVAALGCGEGVDEQPNAAGEKLAGSPAPAPADPAAPVATPAGSVESPGAAPEAAPVAVAPEEISPQTPAQTPEVTPAEAAPEPAPPTAVDPQATPPAAESPEPVVEAEPPVEDMKPSDIEVIEPEPPEPELPLEPEPMGRGAYDLVTLGDTGIVTSRLAMGTGTNGVNGTSEQDRHNNAVKLLMDGYERGIRLYDTADAYGTHDIVGEATKQLGRANVTLLTKTRAESAADCERDLDRFMLELQTDYLDVVLLHIRQSGNWVQESQGAMEVLDKAKAEGRIRATGVSCHGLAPLEAAAATDWPDLQLVRVNPLEDNMDSNLATVLPLMEQMKAKGRAVMGMKILAAGKGVPRMDECIQYATRLDCLHNFTIGFQSIQQLDEVAERIAATVPA